MADDTLIILVSKLFCFVWNKFFCEKKQYERTTNTEIESMLT